MKKFFLAAVFVLLLALGGFFWGWQQYRAFLSEPVFSDARSEIILEVPAGASFRKVVALLRQQGAGGEMWQWRVLGRLSALESQIKAGEYSFDGKIQPQELLEKLARGDVKTYTFTIIEGQTWKQLKQRLLQDPVLQHPLAEMNDKQLLQWLSAKAPSPEGLFLPETWQYRRGDSDLSVLKRAYEALQRVLDAAWQQRDHELPLTSAYEMLILASIVEKETALAAEKPQVAGVFVRRLKKGMRLQTDPTVIYGLGEAYAGDITYAHLRTDTPYNTYTRAGLPPTPISMAGRDSIEAVAHPAKGDALYFVADNQGGHVFSTTFSEHKKAVKNYLAGQTARDAQADQAGTVNKVEKPKKTLRPPVAPQKHQDNGN